MTTTQTDAAAYAVLIDNSAGTHCYAVGDTRQTAMAAAKAQWAGAMDIWSRLQHRLYTRALNADEASEVAEMLAAPWN